MTGEQTPETVVGHDLSGRRFLRADLSDSTWRGVELDGAEVESPWLMRNERPFLVNGVDVAPLVDAALDERFPGRSLRGAAGPDGLRAAWAAVQGAWDDALARAASLPAGTVEVSVDGEWSFAQTLRHLVMATDVWLGRGVLGRDQLHPLGLPHAEYESDGFDLSVFDTRHPGYDEVLVVRAEHVAWVRDFLAGVTTEQLDEERPHPWAPEHPTTVRACLHVVLGEEWEHLRFALRDLDALAAG